MQPPTGPSIDQISRQMATLVRERGWEVVNCQAGFAASALIRKNGVLLGCSAAKGETDYSIRLVKPAHPPVSPEIYRTPDPGHILKVLGIDVDGADWFVTIDDRLGDIKKYLMSVKIWENNVIARASTLRENYNKWMSSQHVRETAEALRAREPWVASTEKISLRLISGENYQNYLRFRRRHIWRYAQYLVGGAIGLALAIVVHG